ncbi:MAG: response regulator [Selenomonadaceae bacterium]|nr:response regulator [Selenomonadaceae bacterium]
MKRVLIVDDDFLVRTYLKQMIAWEEHGFYIVGDAKNGQEALELLQRDGADILIADMSMPIMDGIELTRRVRRMSPRTHILILSCHDDFVYVKEAMKLGIDDYLLKNNLTEETLLEALNKISFEAEESSDMERLALIGRKKLREDFFQAFDTGNDFDKLDDLASDSDLNVTFQTATALMIIPKNWIEREQLLSGMERENFLSAFAEMSLNACKNTFGDKVNPMIFVSRKEGFFHWCLIVDATTACGLAERLQAFAKMYFNLELKIFLSPPKKNLAELSEAWHKLYEARTESFYSDAKIFSAEDLPPLEIKIPDELKTSGRGVVEALSYIDEDFSVALQSFRERLLAARLHPEILSALVAELFSEERNLLPSPLQAENFSVWFGQLENFLNSLRSRQGKDYLPPAIRLALRYIEAHYHEDISQSDVADAVHLNSSYFSTLFKKSVGKGFSDYLTDLRIEHVKERLATTSEKIKDISTAAGFTDYQYFCKLFKRLTNLTPSQYRQKFLH